jgi:hypothetical protein
MDIKMVIKWPLYVIVSQVTKLKTSQLLAFELLTVKFRQPSHEFIFGVGMNFIPYPLVLTPLV